MTIQTAYLYAVGAAYVYVDFRRRFSKTHSLYVALTWPVTVPTIIGIGWLWFNK